MQLCNLSLFERFAKKAKVPKHLVCETMKQTAEQTRKKWGELKADFNLTPQLITAIDAHMKAISL